MSRAAGGLFRIEGESFSSAEVIESLLPLLTPERREKIQAVVACRTLDVVAAVEDLYDRGNVSAVMRSAEGLGLQTLHVVQKGERFKEANRVTQGADKWLDVQEWKSTQECVKSLRREGYKICVTTLDGATPISEIDFTEKKAIFFGNEKEGASDELLDLADEKMFIPMLGFTQSFNISVAAALTFYHVREERKKSSVSGIELSREEQAELLAKYLLNSVGHAERILLRSRAHSTD